MDKLEKISVVVPIFNEAESLEELYLRTQAVFYRLNLPFEFIAVDDGSSDSTYRRLSELHERFPNIGIIRHRANHGKSMALMQGFALAEGVVAITMDADLQDEPENIPTLLEKLNEGYDMVIGWRTSRNDPASKRFVSSLFNKITRRLLNVHIHDINCGLKIMRKDLYKRLNLRGDLHRLVPAMSQALGFTVGEVPVTHSSRKYGKSKYKLIRHRGLLDIISLTSTHAYRVRPFHVFTEIAFFAWCLFSICLVGLVLVLLMFQHSPLILYVASPVLLFASLTFLLIGTTFPIIGLVLDNLLVHFNDERWRSSLIKEVVPPESC